VKPLDDALAAWKARAQAAQLPNDETMTSQLSSEELRRLRALGYVGGGTTAKPATNKVANPNPTPAGATNAITNTNAPAPQTGTNSATNKKEGSH
jgi:hypothetical protein